MIEKLEKRKYEIKSPFEEDKEKTIIYEDWNLQDIADKINEIIELLNEKLGK